MNGIVAPVARRILALLAGPLLVAGIWAFHRSHVPASSSEPLAHARSEFSFTVHAPMSVAAPLFGPDAERAWGGSGWQPRFLYPEPARDVEGAVFSVQHGGHESTWVLSVLDILGGHVQYVSLIDGVILTRIDTHLKAIGAEPAVTVVYERTSLQAGANEHVKSLGQTDGGVAKHWESNINDYLKTTAQPKD
jgi:hypothetical protein